MNQKECRDYLNEISYLSLTMTKPTKRAENALLEQQVMTRVLEMLMERKLGQDKLGDAAALEIAINDAINTGKPKNFQEAALGIAQSLKARGVAGAASKPPIMKPSDLWLSLGAKNGTPKTDILIGNTRISLKMGSSQFMSGESPETKATLVAAAKRAGLDKIVVDKALKAVNSLQKNIEYSADVSDLRKMPGYIDPATGEKNPGKASKEIKMLMTQEAGQEKFLEIIASVLDPAINPGLRIAFIEEAMDGEMKFNNSIGTAEYLLAVAGKATLYDPKKGLAALGPDAAKYIESFMHFDKIDQTLATKYDRLVSIQVKFKTRKSGSSDVIGAMLGEAKDFREKLQQLLQTKKETRHLYPKSLQLINEGAWDDLKSLLGSTWNNVKIFWNEAMSNISALAQKLKQKIISAAKAGLEYLLNFLGIDFDVFVSPEINWFV
jgi:hypothetical protein